MNAYEKVVRARSASRPSGAYYIGKLFDSFYEFKGDRRFSDDGAIIGGIGSLLGIPVTVIAMERGETIEERMRRNFGCPSPEGYRKALRLMKQAEKFHRPVITFISSPGAYCGIGAEERGQGQAIAENLMEMSALKTPVIAVVLGEGGSGGALALSVADRIFMLEDAVYSVISPEGCASILFKDSAKAPEAAEALKLTAEDLERFGIADRVIKEEGKTQKEVVGELSGALTAEIKKLSAMSTEKLLCERYNKFRKIGR